MSTRDPDFEPDLAALMAGIEPVTRTASHPPQEPDPLPANLPETGIGAAQALGLLAPMVLGGAARLGSRTAFAHMDPPTPWVTWVTALWNASLNQNLLHPDLAPAARKAESRVIDWIAPAFGMDGGHMTPGSTVSNFTALWAAREIAGVRRVVASAGAHLSVAKSAHLLGLDFETVATDRMGALEPAALPRDLSGSALVLTAGATSTGAIDPLTLTGRAAWTHVDAAWSGPLRFSSTHRHLLDHVEAADSLAISAHKWLFQPKESALILFRDTARAHAAVSFGGAYLATPNIGLLGSHGAAAVPLLATLLAWGRKGLERRLDQAMASTERFHAALADDPRTIAFGPPQSGVLLWRPSDRTPRDLHTRLPAGMASLTTLDGKPWLRHVAANPMADTQALLAAIDTALATPPRP